MKKRLIVNTGTITSDQEAAITESIKSMRSVAWWHWLPTTWLVLDYDGKLSASSLRDQLLEAAPKVRMIVIDMPEGGTWSGFGPANEKKDMFKWIKETWQRPKVKVAVKTATEKKE